MALRASLPSSSNYDGNKGGKSGAKVGQSRVVRAVCRAFGSVIHRLLVFSSSFPQVVSSWPLCTTLYHILALSRLLSSRNLRVYPPLRRSFWKIRVLVV